jgi:hypothetical protein
MPSRRECGQIIVFEDSPLRRDLAERNALVGL